MKHLIRSTVITGMVLILIFAFTLPVLADGNVYKKGERSADIAKIQQALKDLKLFNEEVTGYFGEVTEQAVKRFQKQKNLEADGIVGPSTLMALFGKTSMAEIPSRGEVERVKVNVTYRVQAGDTIWDIAEDFNVTRESILKYNNLKEDSVLQIGQKIIIPNVIKTVVKVPSKEPKAAEPKKTNSDTSTAAPPANETEAPEPTESLPDNLYIVKEGDTLLSVAEDYGVTAKALAELNKLAEDAVLQPEQELKIPEAEAAAEQPKPPAVETAAELKGEYLGWYDTVQYLFEKNEVATVTDVKTGKSFKIKRLYGRNHADVEPLTKEDTAVMKSIYGSWSWDRRSIIVTVDGKNIAASMNGMPHGGEQIDNNGFKGHFCIHFKGSKTHKGNRADATHQAAVKFAAGIE